jgi:dihydroflavonol-4-reductase
MTTRVLLSGATGFIASHTIAALLAAGHEVVGTVRKPDNLAATAHLRSLPGAAERLELVGADLETPGAFDAHARDVDYVLHMASPYQLTVADANRDLVQPAVQGTRNMLAACAGSPRVKRVLVTSSMAAITDEPDSERVLTEADWNTRSSLTRNPYYFSKAEAERAAWDFHRATQPPWSLVVINPFIVIGPSMVKAVNESNKILVDLMNGAYPAIMSLTWGFVDVRDVADAHLRALSSPLANGRYLCAGETRSMRELVALLRATGYAHTRLPKFGLDSAIGNKLALLAAYTQPKGVASYLRSHLGRVVRYDNGKIQRDLGVGFRPLASSVAETAADLVRWGHVAAAPRAA